jgi:chloramphenicol-sensitive protein RarD
VADQQVEDSTTVRRNRQIGLSAALSCYIVWGVVPLYFRFLNDRGVGPSGVLAYRITWSAVFVAVLLTGLGHWNQVVACFRSRRVFIALLASTVLISINWWVYIYSVATKQVTYSALGYYVNPLVTVLLGVGFLGERLRKLQVAAVLLAACGVAVQTYLIGKLPWISLSLAISFGLYGLVRKLVPATALAGLMIETALIAPITLSLILHDQFKTGGSSITLSTHGFLALSGVITAVPLILFAAAARRLRLTTMGFLQFLSPSIQLAAAVLALDEPFGDKLITFTLIWSAVAIFLIDQVIAARRTLPVAPPGEMET